MTRPLPRSFRAPRPAPRRTPGAPRRTRGGRHRRQAGFTLLEMMVALVAGAIAIGSIYYVSAASSRHFQEQQRLAQSQMALRMAMEQIRRDVGLAGFLATPNSAKDNTCMAPMVPVTAVELLDGGATAQLPYAGDNGVEGDVLRLTGNYVTSDGYLAIGLSGAGNRVFLQRNWQAFRRTFGVDGFGSGYSAEAFQDVFRAGRWLHIATQQQRHFFVQITGSSGAEGSVSFSPALPVGGHCVVGLADGAMVSPITKVEYTILNAQADGTLASLRIDTAMTAVEGTLRPALVRRELDIGTNAPIAQTERVIAEYVADFDVDFIVDDQPTPGAAPILRRVDDGDAQTYLGATVNPHRARTALVRLSLRTPREDPRFPFVPRTGAGVSLTSYELSPSTGGAARVRTAHAEILMPNIANRMIRP